MAETTKKKLTALQDFRALDEKSLIAKIAELRKELVEQHRALAANELPNPRVITTLRKNIAKAMTVLAQMQQAAKKEEK